jgi:hypothetical protein
MIDFIRQELTVPVMDSYDLVVAGGGPAGLCAAITASRKGFRVLLIERYGFLGGMAAIAMVGPFMPTFAGEHQIIKGLFKEIVDRMIAENGAIDPKYIRQGTGFSGFCMWPHAHVTPFDHEVYKKVVMDMVLEANVNLLLHTFISDCIVNENKIDFIIVENKSGRQAYRAKCFIDGTGDGDLAFKAGVPYEKGRPEDGLMQPGTLFFRVGDVDREALNFYIENNPEERHLKSLVSEAVKKGEYITTRDGVYLFFRPRLGEVLFNTTRINQVDGTNVFDLTKAEIETRKQVNIVMNFLKKYAPGFEKCYLIDTGMQVGFRETRRIEGEYKMTKGDILSTRQFEDNIAQCSYMIDIHTPTGTDLQFTPIEEGKSYGIPYRCLVPKRIDNLLVAGRCVSSTHEAQAAIRVMPPCMCMGQAAGGAVAQCLEKEIIPRSIDVKSLQKDLIKQGQVVYPVGG